ncbi:MAG: hypothetical protein P8Z81_14620, partial [Deinococcales bacterium]
LQSKHPGGHVQSPSVVSSDAGPSRERRPQSTVKPNRWMGEGDCLIGPFTCRRSAAAFAGLMVDFGHYENLGRQVVVVKGTYYVEVYRVGEGGVVSS